MHPRSRGAMGLSKTEASAMADSPHAMADPMGNISDVPAAEVWVIDEPLSWPEAVAACENLGGRLATIHSRESNNGVMRLISKNVWIGASDSEIEGEFRWLSDDSLLKQEGSFVNWAPGEPNNDMFQEGPLEDCVEMRTDGSWNDLQCIVRLPFACEFGLGKRPTDLRFAPWRLPRAIEYAVHRHPGLIISVLILIIVLTQMANLYICAWKCRQIKKARAGPDSAEDEIDWVGHPPPVRMLDLMAHEKNTRGEYPLAAADSYAKQGSNVQSPRTGSGVASHVSSDRVSIAPRSGTPTTGDDDTKSNVSKGSKGTDL